MAYSQADENRDLIVINGFNFYSYEFTSYGNTNTKTYVTSPSRNSVGSIMDIYDINTFFVPRLRINFDVMNLDVWRRLKIAFKPNAFIVQYYDWESDMRVTHEMYFATQDDIDIFQNFELNQEYYVATKKTFDIVGTNNEISKLTVLYNSNHSIQEQKSVSVFPNELFYILDSNAFARTGYNISSWNTKPDGTGVTYANGMAITISNSLFLYAQWVATADRTLYFYYQGVNKQELNPDTDSFRASQAVRLNGAVGALPSPKMQITVNGALKEVGTLYGWWNIPYDWKANGQDHATWLAKETENSLQGAIKQYTSETVYNINGNTTIYAHWKPNKYTIMFNSNGGTEIPSQEVAYQNKIIQPENPTLSSKAFAGWFYDVELKQPFSNWYMPYENLTVYAKWNEVL